MIRLIFIGLALVGLAGCSQLGGPGESSAREQQWQQWQQALQAYDEWDLHARAVVTLPGEVYHVGLQWRRSPNDLLLLLEAPFGQGVIRIESGSGGLYRLSLPDGRVYLNHSPGKLLEDVIIWPIPVDSLDYWIRGMPRPDADYSRFIDGAGLTSQLVQDGWTIKYQEYTAESDGPTLPRRMRLANDDLQLRLVVDQWQAELVGDDQSELFPEFN